MTEDKFSEADLCREFRTWAEERKWVVHPEVAGWDLVLVGGHGAKRSYGPEMKDPLWGVTDRPDFLNDTQVGVQAKLCANVDVLEQATVAGPRQPRFRMVLVRRASEQFLYLAQRLKLCVAVLEVQRNAWGRKSQWQRHAQGFALYGWMEPYESKQQLTLPSVVTDLVAGGPAPKQLTPWREKALAICRILQDKGTVTTADFKKIGIDWRRWDGLWLARDGAEGRHIRFVAKPGAILPIDGWEEISKALAECQKST